MDILLGIFGFLFFVLMFMFLGYAICSFAFGILEKVKEIRDFYNHYFKK